MAQSAAGGWWRQGNLARAGLYGPIVGVVLSVVALPALAAPLQIVVTNVESSKGQILVAVCSEREFLQPHCAYTGRSPARPGPVTITIEIPPGTYAVQAFQDEDGNGQLTTNFLGAPTEPLGFSNNPTVGLSAPRYRDCAIQVGAMGGRIEVRLKRLF